MKKTIASKIFLVACFSLLSSMSFAADRLCRLSSGYEISAQIAQCLNAASPGDRLLFPPGTYFVSKTIEINKALSLTTLNRKKSCGIHDVHECAEFRANTDFFPTPGEGIFSIKAEKVTVQNLVINGAKEARVHTPAGVQCAKGNNGHGYNFSVFASHFKAVGITTKNALCATGFFAAKGISNLTMQDSFIANNGVHHQHGMWADGVTVHDIQNSNFSRNTFLNNTDIDLIFGGCQNCVVENNLIQHDPSFEGSAFAALMIHAWPNGATSGNFQGTVVRGNLIDCGPKRCGFGIYLGAEAWYSAPLFGGRVENNEIRGAMLGFNVDRSTGMISIANNYVKDSGGRFLTACGPRRMGSYNISPDSMVDLSQDKIPSRSYDHEKWTGCIPNWWTQDSSRGI